jgi:mycothiol synthase
LEENGLLKIKRFTQGSDEEIWVRVWNAAYKEYDDLRQITADEFRIFEKAPFFDSQGRFIAELNNKAVGIIHAHVDKKRKEKKAFVQSFGVIPEFRGRGIEEELAETALKELKSRGMEAVQGWASDSREDRMRLWENLGFKLVRKFSLMKRGLDRIQSGIGENEKVVLKPLRMDVDEDVRVLNWLDNECFKEHFNYRPSTVEETTYRLRKDPFFKDQAWFFAFLNEKPVGYIGVGVDEKYNVERSVQCGWILDIGVLKPIRLRGIGTRLMLQGMKTLKAKDMTTVMLGVDDGNVTKAMKLYEKVGFKVVRKDLTYEKNFA